jgi:hypothetical protein
MTLKEFNKQFAYYTEDAQFQNWSKGAPKVRFVYACEYGTIWKFTPKEWWQFVRKAISNQGNHDLLLSRALRRRPNHITKAGDRKIYSSDNMMRCVNPLDWTVQDWMNELIRTHIQIRRESLGVLRPEEGTAPRLAQKAAPVLSSAKIRAARKRH